MDDHFHNTGFCCLVLMIVIFMFFSIASLGSVKICTHFSLFLLFHWGLCYWCCRKEWFLPFPLLLLLSVVLFCLLLSNLPSNHLHLCMGVIVLLGCIAVKCGEECFACRNASVPHVSTVSSPLPHPWDSGRTIWTPDILGLLCASVTVM